MASNAPTRKPSNSTNSRISHKALKLEMTSLARSYHQPVVISASGKDVSKDKEKKLKPQILKINTKQPTKRVEIVQQVRPVIAKASSNERHTVMEKPHMEQQQPQHARHSRKVKPDNSVSRSKDLRSAVVETILVSKHLKEPKSPEKPETSQRQIRTKNQSHNTKVFFDKYLKFAYDLSTPTGVRQLEDHFFPKDQGKSNSKANELENSSEKQNRTIPDEKTSTVRQNTDAIDQKLQQSKCFENAQQ
ncbi:uncharacterized protein LOC117780523 [Drosophila innubila]|uniref:uncharacterized protein LOC117780523 n=1 Tax=Drosophila innubila TaxID=198719 RepID=UPI00148C8EB1|nr:uncharacterized protein LOC117780523 [Drosophila innubila]